MLIKGEQLQHWINNFFGYGSWNARIWFVGYEEGGGELPEEVAEKINHFYSEHGPNSPAALCDIREMYKQIAFRTDGPNADSFANLYEYRFSNNAVLHGSWKNLIAFVHGYRNEKLPNLLRYQKNSFATGSEALIQLYPLPSPHNHAWYYGWLDLPQMGFIRIRKSYEQQVYPTRMNHILQSIREYKPEVVLMYGMNNINTLKQSVHDFFPSAKFKMIQATKRVIPQHHRAEIDGTMLAITTQIPALRHNRIESGFEWEEFGKCLKSGKRS